jgi:cytochrome c peroxidase
MRAWILSTALLGSALAVAASNDWPVNDDVADVRGAVPPRPSVPALESLGRRLFFDPGLSASHRLACASCHDPAHAYGPPDARAAQSGGLDGRRVGQRAVPSLRYLQAVPVFTEHYFDEAFDESVDNGPTGGLTWDGRVQNPHEQAALPLLSSLEMANRDSRAVVDAVRHSAYAAEFQRVFGEGIFSDPQRAFDAITRCLEVFQQDPAEFYPYSSKYDAYLRRQTTLSQQEARGLALFNDPSKGNCAHCHQSQIGGDGAFPAFTDFGYVALGVPRNLELPMNRDPHYYDLGLCGPLRQDLKSHREYCGFFRTPTLRNVTLRQVFFHNGALHDIKQVLHFYVERDLAPQKWYPRDRHGVLNAYDDLPAPYRDNIDREPPVNRLPGEPPALSDAEIDDIIAFLDTLTDGWSVTPISTSR